MPEIFKTCNLHLASWLALVQVVDHLRPSIKPDKIQIEFFAHRIDQGDQILVFLFRAIQIALFINQPGNLCIRTELGAQLFGAQTRGAHKVRPPMIVRIKFVFFPLIQGRSADHDDIFAAGGEGAARHHQQQ